MRLFQEVVMLSMMHEMRSKFGTRSMLQDWRRLDSCANAIEGEDTSPRRSKPWFSRRNISPSNLEGSIRGGLVGSAQQFCTALCRL